MVLSKNKRAAASSERLRQRIAAQSSRRRARPQPRTHDALVKELARVVVVLDATPVHRREAGNLDDEAVNDSSPSDEKE